MWRTGGGGGGDIYIGYRKLTLLQCCVHKSVKVCACVNVRGCFFTLAYTYIT